MEDKNNMTEPPIITTLFLDIGGVLLTNGWDHNMRREAASKFNLNYNEMNERHHLTFDTYEEGKLSLEEYLSRVVFYEKRDFSHEEFKSFMLKQSQPFPQMINFIKDIKERYNLKVAAVSNEGRELTIYRIREFNLEKIIQFFISSCFVHYRKPDEDIYRIALDIAQEQPEKVAYIDDRPLFVEVARGLGIRGVIHKDFASTKVELEAFGLSL
jgi:putative hydrolase of the HAD superfamily